MIGEIIAENNCLLAVHFKTCLKLLSARNVYFCLPSTSSHTVLPSFIHSFIPAVFTHIPCLPECDVTPPSQSSSSQETFYTEHVYLCVQL